MILQDAADFYGCPVEELEYYMRLGGSDPRRFIPAGETDREEFEQAAKQTDKILAMAENASCLENQCPSGFLTSYAEK
ncbi:MAG: hypothetical protein HDQ91_01350 [Desulfovibrio sp.]|nr:hypothetical protein [Desulfovibrio sp.]